jgi:exopolysaccharide biosynthesis polyprenyl glycosylphosphotransferase
VTDSVMPHGRRRDLADVTPLGLARDVDGVYEFSRPPHLGDQETDTTRQDLDAEFRLPESSWSRSSRALRRQQSWLCVVSDVVGVVLSIGLTVLLYNAAERHYPTEWRVLAILLLSFTLALATSGAYTLRAPSLSGFLHLRTATTWHGLTLGVIAALIVTSATTPSADDVLQVDQAGVTALLALLTIPGVRLVTGYVVGSRTATRRVLILGTGRVAASLAGRLERCPNVVVVGVVDDDPQAGQVVLGEIAELPEICARHRVDHVVVAFSRKPTHETLELLRFLRQQVAIWVVPRMYELVTWRSVVEELHGIPLVDVAPAQVGPVSRATKRLLDILLSSTLLVLLAPLFGGLAVAVKRSSPGVVLFRQLRIGRGGTPFLMYKFRTMHTDAEQQKRALADLNEASGPLFKMRNDPRVTRLGEWLRKTSLDELPQLLNVLRGDMSLVGPRPFPVEESEQITGWAGARFSVRPGMTGLWQVSGRSALSYDDMRHLDYVYVASWSLRWDLRILLQTPVSVLRRRGVL